MKPLPAKAALQIQGTTVLPPAECLALIAKAASETTPGANSVGLGLSLASQPIDESRLAFTMEGRHGVACRFDASATSREGVTHVRIGGLTDATINVGKVMFIPVTKEISGFSFYKRFLATVQSAIKASDPQAAIAQSTPSG